MKLELVSKTVGVKTKMKLNLRGMKCRKKDNTCATLLDTLNDEHMQLSASSLSFCYEIKKYSQPAITKTNRLAVLPSHDKRFTLLLSLSPKSSYVP